MIKFKNSVILVLFGEKNFEFYNKVFGEKILCKFDLNNLTKDKSFGVVVNEIIIKQKIIKLYFYNLDKYTIIKNLKDNNIKFQYKKNSNILIFNDLEGHIINVIKK